MRCVRTGCLSGCDTDPLGGGVVPSGYILFGRVGCGRVELGCWPGSVRSSNCSWLLFARRRAKDSIGKLAAWFTTIRTQ